MLPQLASLKLTYFQGIEKLEIFPLKGGVKTIHRWPFVHVQPIPGVDGIKLFFCVDNKLERLSQSQIFGLGWKGFTGTNNLAAFSNIFITNANGIKLFCGQDS
jgi:hypothetical protein